MPNHIVMSFDSSEYELRFVRITYSIFTVIGFMTVCLERGFTCLTQDQLNYPIKPVKPAV